MKQQKFVGGWVTV